MSRKKKIDRDELLNAAEDIVRAEGPSGLTIEALANAMGITKGGVQYSFRSKDELIHAMIDRWTAQYDRIYQEKLTANPSPDETLNAHLEAAHRADSLMDAKAAALLAALVQTKYLASIGSWYREQLDQWATDDPEGRTRRLKFLASEGAILLRFFGFLEFEDEEWNSIFRDIRNEKPYQQES